VDRDGLDHEVIQNMVMPDPPKEKTPLVQQFVREFNREDYLHSARQSVFLFLGGVANVVDGSKSDDLLNFSGGFLWELPKRFSPKMEAGVTWTNADIGHVNIARKHIVNEKGAFRPFYRYGLMLKLVADQQTSTVSNLDNYLLRAGVGLEDIVKPPRSVRMDLDLAVGQKDVWILLQYGYSWGW
jgi:hypothetical protein